jgi:YYY domain-containing protein
MQQASLPARLWRRLHPPFAAVRSSTSHEPAATTPGIDRSVTLSDRIWLWLARRDPTFWALLGVSVLGLILRLYGINWDANNHLHPDERQIVFQAMCLSLPGMPRVGNCAPVGTGPGWFFSVNSPLNPHFFAYGSFPLYLLAAVCHALAWLTNLTGGHFLSPDGGVWDDFNHFTLVGRALSALFDAGTVLLAGVITRRLAGNWAALLAAAFVATIPFEVQVAHFYAVDTLMLFFVMLALFGCLLLAQAAGAPARDERAAAGQWWAWRLGVLIGFAYALAIATKVSALPLAIPILVALLLCWRRYGREATLLALLGIISTGLIVYTVTSPYTFLDWKAFQQQVTEQTMLSQGQLDYPYVRQFADASNFIYPLRQLLLYDMGLPLGLLGIVGFFWAASKLWRTLNTDWIILVSWLAVYFAIVGGAYTKFTRYMLPIFTGLAICGAAMVVALSAWGAHRIRAARDRSSAAERSAWWRRDPFALALARRMTALWGAGWWRGVCLSIALGVLLASTFATLALLNIYSVPNTRVQASVWIYEHVPAGSLLTSEVWDDPLPIQAPPARVDAQGVGYTADGAIINPGAYQQVGLNLYDDDTTQKAQQLAQSLATANVVVISSQRLLKSIPKLPDRYPMTTRYYDLLFAGKLGFKLAAHFDNRPNLLGVTLDDSGADESFSVYDHPPVWIFTRDGSGLTQEQIVSALTDGISLPPASARSGSQKSLLLSPQDVAANSQSQPLGVQFPAESLPNSIPLLWWLLIVELLGIISFPLAFSAFPGLRDRGWGLSKVLGLLILAWATWFPSSLKLLPFDHWAVVLVFALLAALGALVAWLRRDVFWSFVRARWRLLVIGEALFLVAFLVFTWIRALDPDLWHIYRGGEKPMELAFINGILRSRYMPPLDPWFSGGYINYYYYGQYLIAVLIKLTGIAPTTAFNLAIPLLFGLTASAAFSVVAGMTGRWWAGSMGGVGLVVVGNLDGLLQLGDQVRASLAGQLLPAFDYWRSSRVIPFTINEFPYWSFLYADLHAHLIDLPIVVVIVAACGSLLRSGGIFGVRWRVVVPTLAVAALALGAAWCTNTWDLPTYGALLALVLLLQLLPSGSQRQGVWQTIRSIRWPAMRNVALAIALTFAGAYALYLPFHANFQNFVSGIGPVTTPTSPVLFAVLFGIWLFLVVTFFFIEARDRLESLLGNDGSRYQRLLVLLAASALILLLAFVISLKVFLLVLLGVGVYLAFDGRHSPLKRLTYLVILLGLAVAFGVEIIYVRDFLDHSDWERMNTVFKFYYQVWVLLSLGGTLALSQVIGRILPVARADVSDLSEPVEPDGVVVASDDGGDEADALPHPLGFDWGGMLRGGMRFAWALAFAGLLLGSSVFLVEGTQARVSDPAIWAAVQPPPGGIQPQGLSLDGLAYMRGWYPSDYAAINWLNDHVGGAPTIVEASNGPYAWYSRVSIYTGLPAVLGWSSHESQQRYGDPVWARQSDVQSFYGDEDPASAVQFLRKYHVSLVYIGNLERTCYMTDAQGGCVPMSAAALGKFTSMTNSGVLRVIYSANGVMIYQVVG